MAQAIKDSFLDLEKHRQRLEDNIATLRKALRHWQTLDAEYDGLKEEILSAEPTPNRQELVSIAQKYDADLVTGKEIDDILGTGTERTTAQVVNILDRRMDYVQQNARTIEKQIEAAEEKLAKATIISTPEVRNEEGLPVMDIIEELDEEGNVISSRMSNPGSVKPQLLEALQKAGMIDSEAKEQLATTEDAKDVPRPVPDPQSATNVSATKDEERVVAKSSKPSPKSARKGVKFAEDTKAETVELEPEKSQAAKRMEEIMKTAAVIPADESEEDAALRRDMLQYGMSEVGSVVAELNLEDGSDWESEDYADYSDTDDDEDEFGRSKGKVVDDELRQQMIELEQRLGVRMMENVGKDADDYGMVQEGIGRISVTGKKKNQPVESISIDDSEKKSVRFAEELDISPAPQPPIVSEVKQEAKVAPISDIVERKAPGQASLAPNPQKKPSRFKTARTTPSSALKLFPAKPSTPKPFSQPIFAPAVENTRPVPTGPANRTLAPQVVERDVPLNANAAPPDELDPQLLHQEVATEYYRMRNKMIGKQGGFMKEDESVIVPLTEEEGGPKKVSRFKAARLAKS
ncbi:udp-galactose transporter like protein [Rutstroemia sp. NJR-2017a BBW]|nr:udp-galactose transporter like protein [Rutstroemia sp. NJR-2017a BBW]